MKGGFGPYATRTYNGWSFNKPPEPLVMPEHTHEHVNGVGNPHLMSDLARKGADMYHPPKPNLNPDQQRALGQMSITDGVFIPREAPPEDELEVLAKADERSSGAQAMGLWHGSGEPMEITKDVKVDPAHEPGATWGWYRE